MSFGITLGLDETKRSTTRPSTLFIVLAQSPDRYSTKEANTSRIDALISTF